MHSQRQIQKIPFYVKIILFLIGITIWLTCGLFVLIIETIIELKNKFILAMYK